MKRVIAAAAEKDIMPDAPQFLYGYPYVERWSEGVHDRLFHASHGPARRRPSDKRRSSRVRPAVAPGSPVSRRNSHRLSHRLSGSGACLVKQNGLNPYASLHYVFTTVPRTVDEAAWQQLLPSEVDTEQVNAAFLRTVR